MKKLKLFSVLLLAALIFLPIRGGGLLEKKKDVAIEDVVTIPDDEQSASVPVPATVVLFVSGIIGLVGVNRMLRK